MDEEESVEIPLDELKVYNGKQNESSVYVCRNRIFHRDWRLAGIFRCSRRNSLHCNAILYINDENRLFSSGFHPDGDEEDPLINNVLTFKTELKKLALETNMLPGKIYHDISLKFPSVAKQRITIEASRAIIRREREKLQDFKMVKVSEIFRSYR